MTNLDSFIFGDDQNGNDPDAFFDAEHRPSAPASAAGGAPAPDERIAAGPDVPVGGAPAPDAAPAPAPSSGVGDGGSTAGGTGSSA